MAITHKIIATSFIRGEGVLDISARYQVPIATVENAVRAHLRWDMYAAPEQMVIDNKEQMTIIEQYGSIEV